MQDPSHGVVQQLQNHVHLISGHRFPMLPSLNLEQAYRYLLDAPTIVKQTAPMAWNYLNAPQDGTVFLEWISRSHGAEHRFPSDGYVWCDPEQTFRQDFNGYTVEMLVHTVGFRPNHDHFTSHARTRYHFISKAPMVNAPPPDPSLWIVHYHQTEQTRMMDIRQVPISPQIRSLLAERKWLESQGRLERKDFMLHDRDHWPQITVPGSMQPMPPQGMYDQRQMMQHARQGFPAHPNYPIQQPPAKRPRHSGPSNVAGSIDGVHDTTIEDEENTSLGDFFDHLSPREISAARFMQHHQWMEEVFSSPYASSRIVPPDLGLGLMGELKGLTDGILDPPALDEMAKDRARSNQPKEVRPFTNLKKEQVDEFSKRVEKHLEEGQAEISRMKKEHARKMAEWKKMGTVVEAEKRLRNVEWEEHETDVPGFSLGLFGTAGHADNDKPRECVEDIVKEVERTLAVKIDGRKEATMVEKGGLEKVEQPEQPLDDLITDGTEDADQEMAGFQHQGSMMNGANPDIAVSQPDYMQQMPSAETKAEALQPTVPANVPQPNFQDGQSEMMPTAPETMDQSELLTEQHDDDADDVDMGGDSLMDGLDMDVDTGDIDFIEHTPQPVDEDIEPVDEPADMVAGVEEVPEEVPVEAESAAPTVPSPTIPAPATEETSEDADPVAPGNDGAVEAADTTQPPQPISAVEETTAPAAEPIADPTPLADDSALPATLDDAGDAALEPANDDNIFDDGTFDDLANMDNDAGDDDGLIDFGGGMGMEDDAFGEAMHGMDTETPPVPGQLGDEDLA